MNFKIMKINNPLSKNNLLIFTPVILVMILDLVFTMVGQSASYWQNYSFFNEGSPLGQILMLNPIHFILFFIFYLLLIIFLVSFLPKPFNIIVAIGFFLGHVWGSSTWLGTIFYKLTGDYFTGNVWYLNIGYFIFIAVISGICIDRWLKIDKI